MNGLLYFQLVIAVVGTLGTNFSPSTRVHALMALRTMLECHPQPFHALIDVVLRSTLEACRDDVQDVLSSAETLGLMAEKAECDTMCQGSAPYYCFTIRGDGARGDCWCRAKLC